MEGETIVNVQCPFCKAETLLQVPTAGYLKWKRGELIQNALPMLDDQERDVLTAGLCFDCWHDTYPEDDDDE